MSPRLSIVIPVRNGADFVGRAIASAQAVIADALEILVIDDGSTDETPALLHRLAAADPRLVVVTRRADHGASAARNEGIARARADLVCFLDADDLLFAGPVAERVTWLEQHPDIVLSFANYQTLLPDGTIEPRFAAYWPRFEGFVDGRTGMVALGDAGFGLLFGENPVCTSGTIARREALLALGGFDRDLRQAEDWDMWIRLSRQGGVAYSTTPESLHTAREGSLSTDVSDRTRHVVEVVRRHCPHALRHSPGAALAALAAASLARAEDCRLRGHGVASATHYLAALLLQPGPCYLREFARACAALVGLRSHRVASFEERARLAAAGRQTVA